MKRFIPWVSGLVIGVMVLVPYATIGLSFRTALYVQAILLLLLTLSLLGVGARGVGARPQDTWWSIRERFRATPWMILWGLGFYTLATALGWGVAILRSNPRATVAGQVLSMGLLPLAAVAGLSLPSRALLRPYSRALSGAVVFAALLHLTSWASWASLGYHIVNQRLFFANAISVVGPALLGLLLLLTLMTGGELGARWLRVTAWLGAACIALYILLAGVRGLWLVMPPALILFSLLALHRKGAVLALVALLLLGFGGFATWRLFDLWLEQPRPNLLPGQYPADLLARPPQSVREADSPGSPAGAITWSPNGGGCGWALGPPFPISLPTGHTFRLRADFSGPVGARGYVTLQWFDAKGDLLGGKTVPSALHPWLPAKERWAVLPPGAVAARVVVGCDPSRKGIWTLRRLELHHLGRGFLAPLLRQRSFLRTRLGSILKIFDRSSRGPEDTSLNLRYRESRELVRLFAGASWPRRIFGHGLGATYQLEVMGRDAQGKPTPNTRPNYIHNFYLFLLFKLGLVGAALVLTALGLWILAAMSAVRRLTPGFQRSFAAAAAAAFVAYSIWSVASPQILDFRMAPLWGLLLAALSRLRPAVASLRSAV